VGNLSMMVEAAFRRENGDDDAAPTQ
jgi:hypothetical protein